MRMREQIQRLMIESINLSSTIIIVIVARNVLTSKNQSVCVDGCDLFYCFQIYLFEKGSY
ncbi:MAG: hypothetical protein ACI8RD_010973 [Bacillariaceae sp.]|jgi:hypothetical protein